MLNAFNKVAAMVRELFTIGYQGHEFNDFAELLNANRIRLLVDVRHTARSRKRPFAKQALRSGLEGEDLRYVHMPELGAPPAIRNILKLTGDFALFAKAYRKHLASQKGALQRLHELVTAETCCLMCMENDPERCHRSIASTIVSKMNGQSIEVRHL